MAGRYLLPAAGLLVLVAGCQACDDGAVLLATSSTCSDYVHRRADPDIVIDGYEQHWEVLFDHTISAKMIMGYKVISGEISTGFKSITDNADDIEVESLDVRGPNGTSLIWETYVDNGNYRMVKFNFPGGLKPEDGTYMVEVTYILKKAQCEEDESGETRRYEFHARWANIWRIPVDKIIYSFTVAPGHQSTIPVIIEPTNLRSEPTQSSAEGKQGPKVEYAFTSAELRIGQKPNNVAFAWEKQIYDAPGGAGPAASVQFRACNPGEMEGAIFLLFLLILVPIGCCCAYKLCKSKPPPVNTGGGYNGGGYPNNGGGYPNNGGGYPNTSYNQPGYSQPYPPPGQDIPMAQNAYAGEIPMATPAQEPPPYEVAANLPTASAAEGGKTAY